MCSLAHLYVLKGNSATIMGQSGVPERGLRRIDLEMSQLQKKMPEEVQET